MKTKLTGILLLTASVFDMNAQVQDKEDKDTTGGVHIGKITVGGYIDTYYGYNLNEPVSSDVPYFVSMARHHEANINLAYIDLRYDNTRLRAKFVPGFGTYINANNATEPGTLKNIVRARVGVKLLKEKNLWFDFGVLSSPFTNESPVSKDHLMYTRSIGAEYTPFYITGAKLSIPLSQKITAYLYLINGWQQIADLNKGKSLVTQVEWKPSDKNLFNWNTYTGDEQTPSSSNNRNRYFTDVYWMYNPDGRFSITSSAYIGIQERKDSLNAINRHRWWSANFIARYSFTEKVSLSGRFEHFSDPDNVQITPINPVGAFTSYSTGLCMNVKLYDNALFRIEGRQFFSDKEVYQAKDGKPDKQMTWVISNITLWF